MAETAAHLIDHVFPRLAVRQWVLLVLKRLRYLLSQRDGTALNTALRIFLRVIQGSLITRCPGAASADAAALRIGAVAFIRRFGSSLNTHVHFHVCVIDGVFEVTAEAANAHPAAPLEVSLGTPALRFHPATEPDQVAIAQVQASTRKRILRALVTRGFIEEADASDVLAYQHSGFSGDAAVCIAPADRDGLAK